MTEPPSTPPAAGSAEGAAEPGAAARTAGDAPTEVVARPTAGSEPAPAAADGSRTPGVPSWLTATTVAVLIVVVVVASSVGVLAFTRNDGAATPEEAARSMIEAVERRDLLGMAELLPPGERAPLTDPLPKLVNEITRLHLIGVIDPRRVAGPDLVFEGVELRTSELDDEVQAVDLVGGRFTATWPGGGPPLTDAARRVLEKDFAVTVDPTGSSYSRDFARDPVRLVAIDEGGGWHISLAYSAAEELRRRADAPTPTMGEGPPAYGADLPDAAVRDLVKAYADADPERLVTLMYPNEARALYDYAPVFLPGARDATLRAGEQRTFDVQLNELEVSVDGSAGDTRRVSITKLDLDIRDEVHKQHLTYDGSCFHSDERIDDDDAPYLTIDSCSTDRPKLGDRIPPRDNPISNLAIFGGGAQLPTFTVIERNGRWFVSPARTMLDSLVATLQQLQPEDVEAWAERAGASWRGGVGAGLAGRPIEPTVDQVDRDPSLAPERARHLAEACRDLLPGPEGDGVTTACIERLVTTGAVGVNDLPAADQPGR